MWGQTDRHPYKYTYIFTEIVIESKFSNAQIENKADGKNLVISITIIISSPVSDLQSKCTMYAVID